MKVTTKCNNKSWHDIRQKSTEQNVGLQVCSWCDVAVC